MGGHGGDETLRAGATDEHAAPERFAIGSIAAGRYRIVRYIAAGGMGEVYAAHDLVLDTPVALKTLRPELEGSADAIARLRREIALARTVTDAHICRLHDVGEHEGRVFLTMELLDGGTLAELVRGNGLPIAEVERIAAQLVAGLGALHRASIIHRDFKTANVIVVGDRAVITDFGLARSLDAKDARLTIESGLLGTPAYMAPEQVEARPATKASDIYSLGVVLFELLTGKLPFDEDTAMATATARLTNDPPRPSSLRSGIPARWDAIVLRCLAREPAQRFATVDDILGHRPVSRRWLLGAGAGAAAAAALGVWRMAARDGTTAAAVTRSPNEVIAVLPVLGKGSWLTDAWRSAITFDLHDALATVGVPLLALLGHQMDLLAVGAAARAAQEQDPIAAARAFTNVATIVALELDRADVVTIRAAASGALEWNATFSRPANEIGLLVHEVATAIAVRLGYGLPHLPSDARALDAELYERYGSARASLYRPRTDFELIALREGKAEPPARAIKTLARETPQLARAHVVAADVFAMAAEQSEDLPATQQQLDKAAELLNQAVAIDPANAFAHAVLGHAAMLRWDWRRADEETRLASTLAPTHERVAYHRGNYLMLVGRFDEAIVAAERDYERNPHPRLGRGILAWHYYYARRYDKVIGVLEPVIRNFDPTNALDRIIVSLLPPAYGEMARFDDAVRVANELRPNLTPYDLAAFVSTYKLAGRNADAAALATSIREDVDLGAKAMIADALGDTDETLRIVEQMVASHNIYAMFLRIERFSPTVRAHPRFQALLKTVGFP
ncbi:MAG TPA: protein kinase [Kofleriaceae bacterium]|nr:protein kinase [Kofleriaceae bacterium]